MAYNILIVDDSETVRAVLKKTLKLAEVPIAELYTAANGRDALAVLNENWVDLVITDLNMPEMDGFELVGRMQQEPLLKTIPVIVVTTEGSEQRIEKLREQGIKGYVRKPFKPEDIRAVVDEVMAGQ